MHINGMQRLAFAFVMCSGCVGFGVSYSTRVPAHEATFGQTGTENNPPVPSSPELGEWVQGSDGSMGWRTATHAARAMFDRVSDSIAQVCTIESRSDIETRANCTGVHVLVRHDGTNLYRVCEKGTEPAQ